MYRSKYFLIFLLFLLATTFIGCKVKVGALQFQRKNITGKNLLKKVENNYPVLQTLWIKNMAFELHTDEVRRFKGNMRVIRDSIIIIGIGTNFGLEGLRLILTPDTLIILNRLNKTYFIDAIKNVEEFGESPDIFDNIQEIFIGNGKKFLVNFLNKNTKGGVIDFTNNEYCLVKKMKKDDLNMKRGIKFLEGCLDAIDFRPKSVTYLFNKKKINISYDTYFTEQSFFFAQSLVIKFNLKKKWSLHIKNRNINFNDKVPAAIHISKNYTRINKPGNL